MVIVDAVGGILPRALDDSLARTVTLNVGSDRSDFRRTLPREPPPCSFDQLGTSSRHALTYSDEDNILVCVCRHDIRGMYSLRITDGFENSICQFPLNLYLSLRVLV